MPPEIAAEPPAGPRALQAQPALAPGGKAPDAENATQGAVRPVKPADSADVPALQAAAAAAWAAREDIGAVQQAIALWERAFALAPDDAATAVALAQAYFLLGDGHLRPRGDAPIGPMLEAFERGTLAGELALQLSSPAFAAQLTEGATVEQALTCLQAPAVAALAWYAHNLTGLAVARGIPGMLLYRARLEAVAAHLQALDETAFWAAAHRLRGTYLAAAPGFAGGNLADAQRAFARAIAVAPQYLPNTLGLAQWVAVQLGDRALCSALLDQVRRADPNVPVGLGPEQRLAQKRAAWLADRIDRLM